MHHHKDVEHIRRKFGQIKSKQILAIAVTLCTILILALAAKRPELSGMVSKSTISKIQVFIILAFVNFSAWNWRCPSCKKYLGHDIAKRGCKKCGTRFV